MKKVTKKSRLRRASAQAGSQLKMCTAHFLNAEPCGKSQGLSNACAQARSKAHRAFAVIIFSARKILLCRKKRRAILEDLQFQNL
jgi:hypothetical protein